MLTFLQHVISAAGLLGTPTATGSQVTQPTHHDAIVVVLDDTAAADLALYGGPVQTPHLAALAQLGVTFTRAYSSPRCSPSRVSMLTGTWWVRDSDEVCEPWNPAADPALAFELLPEALPQHESAIFGKWHLGGDPLGGSWESAPISQGFDLWRAGTGANVLNCGGGSYTNWIRADAPPPASGTSSTYEPIAVRDEFLLWWGHTTSPKFAYICPQLAHGPMHRPPASLLPAGYPDTFWARDKYEAMIVAFDALLGEILASVNLAQTLVIVVGDNGTPEQVAPNPDRAKGTTYERGVRVPLVVAGYSVAGGRTVNELVHVVDVWRTVIDICGGERPGGSPVLVRSKSLRPILLNTPHATLHDFVLSGTSWGEPGGDVAVIGPGTKLRRVDADGDQIADLEQFFVLPDEQTNLIGDASYSAAIAEHVDFLETQIP